MWVCGFGKIYSHEPQRYTRFIQPKAVFSLHLHKAFDTVCQLYTIQTDDIKETHHLNKPRHSFKSINDNILFNLTLTFSNWCFDSVGTFTVTFK